MVFRRSAATLLAVSAAWVIAPDATIALAAATGAGTAASAVQPTLLASCTAVPCMKPKFKVRPNKLACSPPHCLGGAALRVHGHRGALYARLAPASRNKCIRESYRART